MTNLLQLWAELPLISFDDGSPTDTFALAGLSILNGYSHEGISLFLVVLLKNVNSVVAYSLVYRFLLDIRKDIVSPRQMIGSIHRWIHSYAPAVAFNASSDMNG